MTEHENMPRGDEESERGETVEDLEVPEGQRDEVAGGVSLPYQKVEDKGPDDAG
jgi:hypothetical protein